jgi:ATP-binding cassette subfamily B protein
LSESSRALNPAAVAMSWRLAATRSRRLMAVRLLVGTCPGLAVAVGLLAVATAVLPNAVVVAMGVAVGQLPAAARLGLGSSAGHRMVAWLVAAGVAYAASLLTGPYQDWLSTVVKARLTDAVQCRLLAAVSGPVGVAHLEDPEVLDKLELAQGTLMSYYPGDAPVLLAVVLGNRVGGVMACAVLATFRWWLGAGLLVIWLFARKPLFRITRAQVETFRVRAGPMRRSWYFRELAVRPAASKELRVFGLGPWVVDQYRSLWDEAVEPVNLRRKRFRRVVLAVGAAIVVVYALACGLLGYDAFHHEISLGTLAVMLPMLGMTMTVAMSGDDLPLEIMVGALPDITELEARLAAGTPAWSGTLAPGERPVEGIRFEHVSFRYPRSEHLVLDGLDLFVPAGGSTAIVGVNGAGKTTLVKLLARMHDPTSGRITADRTDLAALDPAAWQHQVAVVFQDFNRYPLTARENVTFGRLEHRDDQAGAARAAARSGATEVIESLPLKWVTVLSRQYPGGVDLSGGQWQRVALARALFAVDHGARVLVLDEPTAWLDARAEAEFFDRILDITRGVTSIIISHRFSTVRRADRICVLADGRLAEQGSHDELMALGGRYAEMFTLQASRFGAEADA